MNIFFCKFLEKLVNIFIAVVIGLVLCGLIVGVVALFEWNLPFSPYSNIVIFVVLVALVWTIFDTLHQKF
jgi:phosphotransferase system  glucose/maltose/N-acetylglucosamine-specific IIC component